MKKLTSILLALVLAIGVLCALPFSISAAETPISFPDKNFDAEVRDIVSKPSGQIYLSDVEDITWLDVSDCGIADLSGIEYFTALEYLYCGSNSLAELDVSNLSNLVLLNCYGNELAKLNVSGLANLHSLWCGDNNLSSLDLSGLSNLRSLSYGDNNLSSLNLSSFTYLEELHCYGNNLSSLDLSGFTNLQSLHCYRNNLSSLDLSGLVYLEELYCYDNNLSSLTVSNLSALEALCCYGNNLNSLTVSNLPSLEEIDCDDNNLSELTIADLPNLWFLTCDYNNLTALNLSNLPSLTWLACYWNNLTNLNVSGLTNLWLLDCRYNYLAFQNSVIGYENIEEFYFDPQKNNIPPHTHSYTNIVTAPTCTAQGYTTPACTCGATLARHSYTAMKPHSWGDWKTTKPATTTTEGTKERKCKVCGKAETAKIAKLPMPTAAKPTADKKAGTYTDKVKVKLTSKVPNAKIYYTLDGKEPTKNSKSVKSGGTVTISKNTTLKFKVIAAGYKDSAVVTKSYKIKTAKPDTKAAPAGKKVNQNDKIKLSAPTGVTLYYTTNGSKPTTKSIKLTAKKSKSIKIKNTTTVKVIAVKKGCNASDVVTRKYTVK